jgi:peptide/nickel transport system permease protein
MAAAQEHQRLLRDQRQHLLEPEEELMLAFLGRRGSGPASTPDAGFDDCFAVDDPVLIVSVFLMLRFTPGDPAAVLAGDAASTEQIAQIRTSLGLDRSIPEQFLIWAGHLMTGRPGPVVLLQDRGHHADRPAAGTHARWRDHHHAGCAGGRAAGCAGRLALWRLARPRLMGFSVLGFSVPVFVLAYLLIWLVSLKLGWFPVQGYKRMADGVGPWLYHLTLPAITCR